MGRRQVGIPFSPLPFRFHEVRYSDQMEKIGADAIRVRRVVVVRRIAAGVDIEEVVGVVRIHRALPPIVTNLRMPTSRHSIR